MFCPNCGTNCKEGATFCGNCGFALNANQTQANAQPVANPAPQATEATPVQQAAPVQPVAPVQPAAPAAPKSSFDFKKLLNETILPFIKKFKVALIAVAALIVAIIAFCIIGSSVSNPENVVEDYIEGLKSSDWEAVYDTLAVEESEFVNYDLFVKYQENQTTNYSDITNYTVTDYNEKISDAANKLSNYFGLDEYTSDATESLSDGFVKTYTVTYVTKNSSYEKTMTINLVKQEEKTWLFYPTYKVSTEDIIGSHSVRTYEDATVTIDGVKVTEVEQDDSYSDNSGIVKYTVPAMFRGSHEVKVSHPLCEDYTTNITVSSYSDTTSATNVLVIKDSVKSTLAKTSEDSIKKIINGIMSGKTFDSLGITCTKESENLTDIKNKYSSISSYLKKDDGTGLKKITLTEFTDGSSQTKLSSDGTYSCFTRFSYSYTETYKSWNGDVIESSGDNTGYMYLDYVYENGNWVLEEIGTYRIYY